jgi:hypothetical protein
MAVTEQQPPPSSSPSTQYVDFDEFLDFQLKKTRRGIHQTDLLAAGITLMALGAGYLLIFAILDQWIIPGGLSETARLSLWSGLVVLAGGWIGWKIIYPSLRQVNSLYAARQIERAHPEFKSTLLSWVNFRQTGRPVATPILTALEKRAAHEITHVPMEEAIDRSRLMRASYVLLGLVVAVCLYTLASPKKMSTTLWRALVPMSSVSVATRTEIHDVKPGDTEVLARDQLDVSVELGGQIPEEATLYFSTADRRFVNEPLRMRRQDDKLPRFQTRLTGEGGKGLFSDLTYFITAGDARSRNYEVRVNQPPSAEVFEIHYEYPAYMGLAPTTQPGSTIDAWEGTWVTVRARPNMPVKRAVVYCSEEETAKATAEEYPMLIRDDLLEARWQLKIRPEDGLFARYYHVQIWNERDQSDPVPTLHRIKIRPDLRPEITLISPQKDLQVPANAVVPVAFTARDPDFLLRRVSLKLQHNGEELPIPPPLFAAPPEMAEFKSVYRLILDQLQLKPGDQLTLYLEAEDNFEPLGKRTKNITRSPRVTLTILDPQPQKQAEQFNQKQEQELMDKLQPDQQPDQQPKQPEPRPEQPPPKEQDSEAAGAQRDAQRQEPMPRERRPDQSQPKQEDTGAQGEPKSGENKQQGKQQQQEPGDGQKSSGKGAGQQMRNARQQTGENQNDSETTDKNSSNQSRPGEHRSSSEPDGQRGTGKKSPQRDKAADDQALKELLDWSKEQEKTTGETPPDNQAPRQNEDSPAPQPDAEKGAERPQQGQPREQGQQQPRSDSPQAGPKSESPAKEAGEQPAKQNSDGQQGASKEDQGQMQHKQEENPTAADQGQSHGKEEGKSGDQPQPEMQPSSDRSGQDHQPGKSDSPETPSQESRQSPSGDSKNSGNGEKRPESPDSSGKNPPANGSPSAPRSDSPPDNQGMKNTGDQQPQNAPGQRSPEAEQNAPSQSPASPSNGQNGETSPGQPPSSSPQNEKGGATSPGNQNGMKPDAGSRGDSQNQGQPAMNSTGENRSRETQQPGEQPAPQDGRSAQQGAKDQQGEPSGNSTSPGKRGKKEAGASSDQSRPSQQQSGHGSEPANSNQPRNRDTNSGESNSQPGQSSQGQSSQGQSSQGQSSQGQSSQGQSSQGQSSSETSQSGEQMPSKNSQPGEGNRGDETSKSDQGSGSQDSADQKSKGQPGQHPGDQHQEGTQQGGNQQGGNQQGGNQQGAPAGSGGMGNQHGPHTGSAEGTGEGAAMEDPADFANRKKATELALRRLRERMQRGETPQELMDQLGYTEQDLERFMQRLNERLSDPGLDHSPETEAARRQFHSLLEGLDQQSQGQLRGGGDHERKASGGFGSGNRVVPPEYRRDNDAYKRKLFREGLEN